MGVPTNLVVRPYRPCAPQLKLASRTKIQPRRRCGMRAKVGDHVRVQSRHVGERPLLGEVLEVHGADGQPPYVVRWEDGHEGTFFPGSDAVVEPAIRPSARRAR